MFVTGLDNDFNVVVDTFLTDVGGHLEVISPAVEGEYSFNLQIRTAELLPGEEETLKLSIYLNETLLREDTDFSYTFTGTFSVWIPESFIYFADPLYRFSLQLSPTPLSYGEASVLIVIARDASNNEIALAASKALTLRVVPEDFFSFISDVGDTVGFEMTGVPYGVARSGAIKLIPYGLIPDTLSVFGIVSTELQENTSKTGQLEFDADMPCVETNLSTTSARPRDTVAVNFSYTTTEGSPATFRPDQQFRVFIADNDSMGLLYSDDGQVGPDLFGALQPIYYVAPDSLSGDSIVVQFFVEPVVSGGAAAAAPVEGPTMDKNSAGARSNAFQMLAFSGCTIAQLVVKTDDLDHFLVTLEKDTVAFTELSKIFVQAKNDADENIALEPSTLLKFELARESAYGTFIKPNGDTLKTIPVELSDIRYDDANDGRVIFAAVAANPDSVGKPLIRASLQNDAAKKGEKEVVVVEQTLKIVMVAPFEIQLVVPPTTVNTPASENRKEFRVRLTRNGQPVRDHPFRLTTDYIEFSGGHDHADSTRPENRENYGHFVVRRLNQHVDRPYDGQTQTDGTELLDYVASIFGDRMRLRVDSRQNNLLWDTLTVTERIPNLVLLGANAAYEKVGGLCAHHGPSDRGIPATCQIPDNNHWADSSVMVSIQRIAASWHSRLPTEQILHINDMSLPFGGKFDVNGKWTGAHETHRTGHDVDIRTDLFYYDTLGQLVHRIGVPVRSPRTEPFNTPSGSINTQSTLGINRQFDRLCRENGGVPDIHYVNTRDEHCHIDF